MLDIETNYKKFKKYLSAYVTRDGIKEFLEWLDTTDFKTAPASTKYHLSEEGGLCKHSLNVFMRLINLLSNEYPKKLVGNDANGAEIWEETCPYSKESIALVALLHDIGKADFYKTYVKNVKNEATNTWEKVPYYAVKDESERFIYGSHEDNSIYTLRQFFKLLYEEDLAIKYHMGGIGSNEPSMSAMVYNAFKSPLALFLHIADITSICIDDNVKTLEEISNEQNTSSTDRASEQ